MHTVTWCSSAFKTTKIAKLNFLKSQHKRVEFDAHEYKITFTGTVQQQVDWRKKPCETTGFSLYCYV